MLDFFSSRTEKKDNKIHCRLCFAAFVYCFFKICAGGFEQHDFNGCFMHKNVHADYALRTDIFENNIGLYAMKIPRAFIITFAVAMRFFPTAKEEISHVRDAMSLRGIGLSLRNLRLRPIIVFEGFITPLLVRASTIAEELSAASITRGLDNPAPRTSFIKLNITFRDTLLTLIFTVALISVLLLRTTVGRVMT